MHIYVEEFNLGTHLFDKDTDNDGWRVERDRDLLSITRLTGWKLILSMTTLIGSGFFGFLLKKESVLANFTQEGS